MVTLSEALDQAVKKLAAHGIDDARLKTELLLGHLLKLDRVGLYVNLERRLPPEQASAFSVFIQRCLNHEPIAFITGHKEFFGIDFQVAPHTLIPRPETELLVEKAIELTITAFPQPCLIADVGTGCGAIGIALALHLPRAKIYATDISTAALGITASNCQRHGVSDRIILLHGDLLDPLPEPVHLILANLPYISDSDLTELTPEISMFEPLLALAGGVDGLWRIRKLISQAGEKLLRGGAVLLEIGHDQGQAVSKLAKEHFPVAKVSIMTDLSGLDRVASIFPTW